ncbi:T9SS type B sorting domain-containing protein [Xanthomarina sp. F2636L]|uniref:T9SS type B sorting domain-containing protein n=1 Tax=Xanthomarina sp. F2636L TaxID=2996018 RepID=UPI00225E2FF0|nr:T9SS type B sorting domain-containing protein [Xanthomarina sp. F2636L]MCX7551407.1 T9SS type B sorting domain-containing protein [Xanthomarina sp. F2636L]
MNISLKLCFLAILSCLTFNQVQAQLEAHLIDGDGWAKGNYIEIGINEKGVFGAKTINKPPNFHNNRESDGVGRFGFIANPLGDGWVDYDGDFFTPGSPEEGFTIEIDGANYSNNNVDDTFQIPGEITNVNLISSDCFEDSSQITWEGNINGLNIKRYYSVTQDGLFIQMKTIIKNLSDTPKTNVFFMHNVDPDNNVTLSGSYETDMNLFSQASSVTDNVCLITASQDPLGTPQDMDGSHVSFYSQNENMRVTYGGFNNRFASAIWNASSAYVGIEGSSRDNVDEAISLAVKLNNIDVNQTVAFTYYYILEEIDDSFIPLIVNIFQENPTVCDGTDGRIVFSGLEPGESYTINYEDDGVFVPDETFIADEDGAIAIENLDAGTYDNINITYAACNTSIDTVFELSDPEFPDYTIEKEDVTDCANVNGKIILHGLTPYTNYIYEYTYNGELIGPNNIEADANGDIILANLDRGTYANFIIEQYGCITSSNETIEIYGPPLPTSYDIPEQFYCDEDYDYITNIDLSGADAFIIGPDNPADFNITYHETELDVMNNVAVSKTNYTTSGLPSYTLYAKKTTLSNNCYSYMPFTITIQLPAVFEINDDYLCVNSDDTPNTFYSLPILSTGLSDTLHTFEWYFEGALIPGETFYKLTANNYGNYSVNVTINATGCSIEKQATILPSGPPQTLDVNIVTEPFSDNHVVEIIAVGHGDYLYAMDEGQYQENHVFYNVPSGYHEFHIGDANGCGTVTVGKTLIGYMKYFTPNNDGYNDFWQIIGVEKLKEPRIYIFDRQGKLLKDLDPHSSGWNGTLNGEVLPSSDYWFKVIFKDDDNNDREFVSHFSLKR